MATDERDDHLGTQEGLDEAIDTPRTGWRGRLRTNPATKPFYRAGVFVLGLACILLGVALAVLPGPLTIPPVLLGLWIWSSEFRFAEKIFDSFQEKAREAWAHAKRKPVSSGAITVAGLVAAGLAFWAVAHFELIAKGKDAVGLG